MSATTASAAQFVGPVRQLWQTLTMTRRTKTKRSRAYLINIIRIPLGPLAIFITSYLAYTIADREAVAGVDIAGFLLIGMLGHVTLTSAVWEGGSAIEEERFEGTIAALFLTPASRIAVLAGHGLSGLVFLLPSFLVVVAIGAVIGADLEVRSWSAAFAAVVTLLIACLALGFFLSAFFILTRRANLMANVIQHPIYLLSGTIIPRQELPGWLHPLSDAIPVANGIDAMRAVTLSGATFSSVAPELGVALLTSAVCASLGAYGIRKVEHAAKRTGQLDLF